MEEVIYFQAYDKRILNCGSTIKELLLYTIKYMQQTGATLNKCLHIIRNFVEYLNDENITNNYNYLKQKIRNNKTFINSYNKWFLLNLVNNIIITLKSNNKNIFEFKIEYQKKKYKKPTMPTLNSVIKKSNSLNEVFLEKNISVKIEKIIIYLRTSQAANTKIVKLMLENVLSEIQCPNLVNYLRVLLFEKYDIIFCSIKKINRFLTKKLIVILTQIKNKYLSKTAIEFNDSEINFDVNDIEFENTEIKYNENLQQNNIKENTNNLIFFNNLELNNISSNIYNNNDQVNYNNTLEIDFDFDF